MIYVIGIGPGGSDSITPRALNAMRSCEIIAGYTKYINLVRDLLPGKGFISYSMRHEILRCQDALMISRDFHVDIALISSGDSGVYGMAGLMLETAKDSGEKVIIIPGMTAANSAAAVLGAPLMNDYVNISLSDLLTDWSIIEKRLIAACTGDFVICLYNPASNHRPEHFKRACKILLEYKSPDTPAGFVVNSDRERQHHEIMTLSEIQDCKLINMSSLVIIGNSQSYILDGKIITPRGYKL